MLVDCNNFFVSCERVFNPKLRSVPTVVLSNNEACVIARSNEAKDIGIKMAEPVFKCRDILNFFDVKCFSTNFALYGDLSSRVMRILESFSPKVESYSVDEAFLDITDLEEANYFDFGKAVGDRVYKYVGIPVSVGIAPTKTLAKIASKQAKRSGGVCVLLEGVNTVLKATPVGEVWGIGWASTKKLRQNSVHTAYDFVNQKPSWIVNRFGVGGARTYWELKGKSVSEVNNAKALPKSMAHTRSFKNPITEKSEMRKRLVNFASSVAAALRADNLLCHEVIVFLKGDKNRDVYYSNGVTLPLENYSNLRTDIVKLVGKGLDRLFKSGERYKRAGIVAINIISSKDNNSLFENNTKRKEVAERAVDLLNAKWGRTITVASDMLVKPEKTFSRSPEFTTKWQELALVF